MGFDVRFVRFSVANELNDAEHTTKLWTSTNGRSHGGRPLTQKYIHGVQTNQLYIGKITHTRGDHTAIYDGLHNPIIDQSTWNQAQKLMKKQDRKGLHRWTHPHLLKGKLRTNEGYAMSPTSTHRPLTKRGKTKQKRLVRYYISQKAIKHGFKNCPMKTINATHLDELVQGIVLSHLDYHGLVEQPTEVRNQWIRKIIDEVILASDSITISLITDQIEQLRQHDFGPTPTKSSTHPICLYTPDLEDRGKLIQLMLKIQIKKLDGRRLLLSPDGHDLIIPSTPEPRQHIVDAIGLAYRWHDGLIKSGLQIREYAIEHQLNRTRILNLLPLTLLSPKILGNALAGTLPSRITLGDLLTASKQLDWDHQATDLGSTHQ